MNNEILKHTVASRNACDRDVDIRRNGREWKRETQKERERERNPVWWVWLTYFRYFYNVYKHHYYIYMYAARRCDVVLFSFLLLLNTQHLNNFQRAATNHNVLAGWLPAQSCRLVQKSERICAISANDGENNYMLRRPMIKKEKYDEHTFDFWNYHNLEQLSMPTMDRMNEWGTAAVCHFW